jgi:hypothetical protein
MPAQAPLCLSSGNTAQNSSTSRAGCSRTSEYKLKDLFVWLKELCVWPSTSEYELKDFCVKVAQGPLSRNSRTSWKELKDLY